MLINLSDVLSDQHKAVEETVRLEMEEIRLQSGTYPIISKEPVHVKVEHIRGKELLITAETRLSVMIPCDRCLEQVSVSIPYEIDRKLDMKQSDKDRVENLDENDYLTGMDLDVDRLVYLEVLMSWPLKVLCKEDCKGICSQCGKNLNEGPCGCAEEPKDPRMAAISDIFSKFKEV